MGFLQQGYRKSRKKVVKGVQTQFNHYMAKMDYLCEVAHRLSIKYDKSQISESTIKQTLIDEGFDDLDNLEIKLILTQTIKNYDSHS